MRHTACQARKSLWIETSGCHHRRLMIQVRLVRACGSKQTRGTGIKIYKSQARKSLWIETHARRPPTQEGGVRLVRACGSKPGMSLNPFWPEWVRLVRACGSKRLQSFDCPGVEPGQARKSLWIETYLTRPSAAITRWSGS